MTEAIKSMFREYGVDPDQYADYTVVDAAGSDESFSGDDIVMLESPGGVAFEFINGRVRAPDEGGYTLRSINDYRVVGRRWN